MVVSRRAAAAAFACIVAVTGQAAAQQKEAHPDERVLDTSERLQMRLPQDLALSEPIRGTLDQLGREACDQKAIASLAVHLDKAGYRRDAAQGLLAFSDQCGGHAASVRRAANLLYDLSDYRGVADAAGELIKLEPHGDNGYYLRAVAQEKIGRFKRAIDDYATAIELFGEKTRISRASYFGMARSHEALGAYCDAASAIESWVALNANRNDTTQTRSMIAGYHGKGKCDAATSTGIEKFTIARPGQTIELAVTINGVRGVFILDTGATYVSMKKSFAEKAKIDVDADAVIKLNTANGIAEARRGRATQIQLRSLKASNVQVVVQEDKVGSYGSRIDGLLGMSFLSRFALAIDGPSLKVSARR